MESETGTDIQIEPLDPADRASIRTIAGWYYDEWATPVEATVRRLTRRPGGDPIVHLVLRAGNRLAATGGLCREVNLFRVHERFRAFRPWVGQLYTHEAFRNRGYGGRLLARIEREAADRRLETLYLYTFTAESLYRKCGWKTIERVPYKGRDTAVMKKTPA